MSVVTLQDAVLCHPFQSCVSVGRYIAVNAGRMWHHH